MRRIDPVTQARLEAGALVLRDFVWIGARRRDTGALAERGWWSDVGTIDAQVIDARDRLVTRTYIGQGDLVGVERVPLVLGFVAQSVTVTLSMVSVAVEEAVREWDVRRAPIEIHRGILDPASMLMPEPAVRRFVGFVDDVMIPTPPEGETDAIALTCVSLSQELLRSNAAKRSDADQRLRSSTDAFYKDVAVVGDWKITWVDQDNYGK